MPWCPKCRIEYQEEFETCNDCNVKLVNELQPLPKNEIVYDKESLLMGVADDIEADVIESLLKSNNIPVLRRNRETGAYMDVYMGMTKYGIDLYVPESYLEEARKLINTKPEDPAIEENEEELKQDQVESDRISQMRANRARIALFVLLSGIIVFLLFIAYDFIHG